MENEFCSVEIVNITHLNAEVEQLVYSTKSIQNQKWQLFYFKKIETLKHKF